VYLLHKRKVKTLIVEITQELIDEVLNNRNTTTKVRKLSNDEVRQIRELDDKGLKNGEIAKLLQLPPQYVSHVRLGKSYKDVK